jgi:glutathione S-transferase
LKLVFIGAPNSKIVIQPPSCITAYPQVEEELLQIRYPSCQLQKGGDIMLELYQFEPSHYCEKVRFILDYKELEYRKIEVTPGVGQFELYQLSGQTQVPVLKDGNQVIADSSAIAHYLDQYYPNRPVIPAESRQRGLCLLLEEWADAVLGPNSRKIAFGTLSQNPSARTAALPRETPDVLKRLLAAVPGEVLEFLGTGVGAGPDSVRTAKSAVGRALEALHLILMDRPYLVGDQPSLADFTVAGLSLYLKVPEGPYLDLPPELRGQGVPGIADNPAYKMFFDWRDQLYADYRKPLVSSGIGQPTSIPIE